MRLEQLQYFIEIANSNSISIAAENLYISQPALSRSIKSLEDELHVLLLVRTVDGVRLSEAGEALLPDMQRILNDIKILEDNARRFTPTCSADSDFVGTFTVFTLPVIADSILPSTLEIMMAKYPAVHINVQMLDMDNPLTLTIPENCDLIISVNLENILEPDIQKTALHMEPLFIGNSFLVVGKNHPLANKKIVTRSEVLTQKLISHHNGFELSELYSALAPQAHGVEIVLKSNNPRVITQILLKQEAALITNNLLLKNDFLDNDQLCCIPIKNSRSQYFCLYDPHHQQLCYIQEFIKTFKAVRSNG